MMIRVYVNGHGYVMGGNPEKGYRFTHMKESAKPFEKGSDYDPHSELYQFKFWIEHNLMANYWEV